MQIGMVGLGRMGGNMARRLMRGGHKVVAWARNAKVVQELAGEGAVGTTALDDFVAKLAAPRVAWVMVPAGAATEQVAMDLARRLSPGDTLIDGGNSYFKDDVRRSRAPRERRINYLALGTSGGLPGFEREAVPCDVLSAALYARFRSRQGHTFAEKVLSAMRHKFGGHVEQPAGS